MFRYNRLLVWMLSELREATYLIHRESIWAPRAPPRPFPRGSHGSNVQVLCIVLASSIERFGYLITIATTTFYNSTIHHNSCIEETFEILICIFRPSLTENRALRFVVEEESYLEFAIEFTLKVDQRLIDEDFFILLWDGINKEIKHWLG